MKKKIRLTAIMLCAIGICVAAHAFIFRPTPIVEAGTEVMQLRILHGEDREDVTGYFDADWVVEQLSATNKVPRWSKSGGYYPAPVLWKISITTNIGDWQQFDVLIGGIQAGTEDVQYSYGTDQGFFDYNIQNPDALNEILTEKYNEASEGVETREITTIEEFIPLPDTLHIYRDGVVTEIMSDSADYTSIVEATRARIVWDEKNLASGESSLGMTDEQFTQQLETGIWVAFEYDEPQRGLLKFEHDTEARNFPMYHFTQLLFSLDNPEESGVFYLMPQKRIVHNLGSDQELLTIVNDIHTRDA